MVSDPQDITLTFEQYYRSLYSSDTATPPFRSHQVLWPLDGSLPKLSQQDSDLLDSPITMEDINIALKEIGRASGRERVEEGVNIR